MTTLRHLTLIAAALAGAAATAAIFLLRPSHPGLLGAAWSLSGSCLAATMLSVALTAPGKVKWFRVPESFTWVVRHMAFYLGVAAAIILLMLLVMRSVYVGIDLYNGYPWQGIQRFGFGPAGLPAVYVLIAACALALISTGEARLLTAWFWLVVGLVCWACLLADPFQPTANGGFERTDATLIMVECLAGLLLVSVLLVGWFPQTWFSFDACDVRPNVPPGFRTSVALVAFMLNVAVLYHILVPAGHGNGPLLLSGLRAGLAALVASASAFLLTKRSWAPHLADATLGLAMLCLCGWATVAAPAGEMPLGRRFPMIFNSMVFAAALTAGLYGAIALHIDHRGFQSRWSPHLKRFTFFSAGVSLLSGVMMCFWPGIPGISEMDHSLGRMTAGFAGFLFLLLMTLWLGRRTQWLCFRLITVAVAACMISFFAVRTFPFTTDFPH